ncbi:MAG: inositol monophosphatase [Victivallales bacterium]|nr:inositol monophosphatase [Victivallales bacterium]
MENSEYIKYLTFAKEIAFEAGKIISRERNKSSFSLDYKNNVELVTTADIASEKFIIDTVRSTYPEHSILSEESYNNITFDSIHNNFLWIIDPIDGTVNYANNLPQVTISIALSENRKVVAGVVYSPFLNEMFYAVKGKGAFLNNKKIKTPKGISIKNALIGTGFSYNKQERILQLEYLKKVLQNCQDIRRLGSAALDLCYVAMGRLNGYYENVKSWDMAAGALIAKEAGATVGHMGKVPDNTPGDLYGEGLVAAADDIYDKLLKILNS